AELKGTDTASSDYLGDSVAVSGATVLVGADGHRKNAGRAYVFAETANGWKQAGEWRGSDTVAGDGFGYTVAVSGTSAVVGAPDHAKSAGRAYVFTRTVNGWRQVGELKGTDTATSNGFGVSVAISGTTVVAGAPGLAGAAGRAYVFKKAGVTWAQASELKSVGAVAKEDFGYTVAISGTTAVVGAPGLAKDAGRAYAFTNTANGWK